MNRKTEKRNICIVLVVIVALLLAVPVGAASKSSMAKKAYRNMMNSKKVEWCGWHTNAYGNMSGDKFALINIDKKGAPELVVTGNDMYNFYIYAYSKKKIKKLGGSDCGDLKIYPNKKIVYMTRMHNGDIRVEYFKYKGKKFVTVAGRYGSDESGKFKFKYYKNGKKVPKKEYRTFVKKLMKNAKEKKLKMHKATKTNYKKYLK